MRVVTKTLVISAFLIFIFSHLMLLNALNLISAINYCEKRYGDMYTIHPDGFIDLVFNNGIPIPLTPAYYRYGSSTLYGSTFFMIARLTNGSDAIVLLEVNFNEEFNKIIDYSIYPLPLDKNYYAGLATNGSHFWTLEHGSKADKEYFTYFQHLICFSLNKGIISNHTLEFLDPLLYPLSSGEFERTGLQIRNNTLILLESFRSYSDSIDSFVNVTFYDLLSLQRRNSFDAYYSFPISIENSHSRFPESINLDATGTLWIEHYRPSLPSIPFSSWNPYIDFLVSGYSLDSHSADKTLFADYDHIKALSDVYFSSYYFTYQNHTNLDLERLDDERIVTQNKVIDCYEVYEGYDQKIGALRKLAGFRIYSLQKYSFPFPVFQLSIWGVSILFIIAIITFILYTYYHKDPVNQQPVTSPSSPKQISESESLLQELRDDAEQQLYQSLTPQLVQKFKLGILCFLLMSIASFLIFLSSLIFTSLNIIYINSLATIVSTGALGGLVAGIYLFSKNKVGSLSFQGRESVIFMIFYLLGSFLLTLCGLMFGFPIPDQNDLLGDPDNILTSFILFYLLGFVLQMLLLFGVLRFTTYFNDISSYVIKKEIYSLLGVPILGILFSLFKIVHLYQFLAQSLLGRNFSWFDVINELQLLGRNFSWFDVIIEWPYFFSPLYSHQYLFFPLFILSVQIWSGYQIYCILKQLEKK